MDVGLNTVERPQATQIPKEHEQHTILELAFLPT